MGIETVRPGFGDMTFAMAQILEIVE